MEPAKLFCLIVSVSNHLSMVIPLRLFPVAFQKFLSVIDRISNRNYWPSYPGSFSACGNSLPEEKLEKSFVFFFFISIITEIMFAQCEIRFLGDRAQWFSEVEQQQLVPLVDKIHVTIYKKLGSGYSKKLPLSISPSKTDFRVLKLKIV